MPRRMWDEATALDDLLHGRWREMLVYGWVYLGRATTPSKRAVGLCKLFWAFDRVGLRPSSRETPDRVKFSNKCLRGVTLDAMTEDIGINDYGVILSRRYNIRDHKALHDLVTWAIEKHKVIKQETSPQEQLLCKQQWDYVGATPTAVLRTVPADVQKRLDNVLDDRPDPALDQAREDLKDDNKTADGSFAIFEACGLLMTLSAKQHPLRMYFASQYLRDFNLRTRAQTAVVTCRGEDLPREYDLRKPSDLHDLVHKVYREQQHNMAKARATRFRKRAENLAKLAKEAEQAKEAREAKRAREQRSKTQGGLRATIAARRAPLDELPSSSINLHKTRAGRVAKQPGPSKLRQMASVSEPTLEADICDNVT